MIAPYLYIAASPIGARGVFTTEQIPESILIESSPVIVMSREERLLLDQTLLHDYIFEWGPNSEKCCLGLGFVSLYNHSYHSNCEYEMDYDLNEIRVRTIVPVQKGEELLINYNGNWNDAKPVWFDAK